MPRVLLDLQLQVSKNYYYEDTCLIGHFGMHYKSFECSKIEICTYYSDLWF